MNNKYKFLWMLCILFGIVACEEDEYTVITQPPLPQLVQGTADFSNYVAVGASFTAGFADGALFISSQENSFPNILAQQFANLNGGEFRQPLMNDNYGGLLYGGVQIANPRLYFNGSGPAMADVTPTTEVTSVLSGPFNNMGVPGAKSFHLTVPGFGNLGGVPTFEANPYYARMASGSMASVIGDAKSQSPTFFTLSEVGGNDVLGYALDGGAGEDQTGNINPLTYGPNDITDPMVFAQAFNFMVSELTENGAKGIVGTVPYITSLPHFTTVPYNPVPITDAGTVVALNNGYATYNGGLQAAYGALAGTGLFTAEELAKRTISFSIDPNNAMVIYDEDLTDLGEINPAFATIPKLRQATAEDLFVLPLSSLIPQGYGTQFPLEDKWVLTPQEQMNIRNATDAYNATITAIADGNPNVGLVDLNAILTEAAGGGIMFDDFTMTTDLVFGGMVSLDGVHLTARGSALMANKFLEAIDANFETNFVESGTTAKANDFNPIYPLQ